MTYHVGAHEPGGAMPNDPARPPRFPIVAAALCAACVGMAAWTWMRYSYCWELSPCPPDAAAGYGVRDYLGRYVAVRGKSCKTGSSDDDGTRYLHISLSSGQGSVEVLVPEERFRPSELVEAAYSGRVVANEWKWMGPEEPHVVIDASAARLVGASIAGLVVGAMGVFVFTVALRHWLGERRAYKAPAGDAPSGSGLWPE